MVGFNILYKTLTDDDGWESGLAPALRDRDEALDFFNKTMAREKNLGYFTFDINEAPSDYKLVEMKNPPIYHWLYYNRDDITAAVFAPQFNQWRVTLLPGPLLAANHTVFLVAGADKADSVRAVFKEEYDPKKYPAQIASHHGRGVTWFLDEAAGRLMD